MGSDVFHDTCDIQNQQSPRQIPGASFSPSILFNFANSARPIFLKADTIMTKIASPSTPESLSMAASLIKSSCQIATSFQALLQELPKLTSMQLCGRIFTINYMELLKALLIAVDYEPTMLMPTPTGVLPRSQRQDLSSPQLSMPATPADYTEHSSILPHVLLCSTNNLFSPLQNEADTTCIDDTQILTQHLAGSITFSPACSFVACLVVRAVPSASVQWGWDCAWEIV